MNDEDEIRNLIAHHFDAMDWDRTRPPDWDRFRRDFLTGAVLVGAARPATPRDVDGFIDRMERAARANIATFRERTRGVKILCFGSVAVAMAASELEEDGQAAGHDVSGYLLVKTDGRWVIAAHAWDPATQDRPVPAELL